MTGRLDGPCLPGRSRDLGIPRDDGDQKVRRAGLPTGLPGRRFLAAVLWGTTALMVSRPARRQPAVTDFSHPSSPIILGPARLLPLWPHNYLLLGVRGLLTCRYLSDDSSGQSNLVPTYQGSQGGLSMQGTRSSHPSHPHVRMRQYHSMSGLGDTPNTKAWVRPETADGIRTTAHSRIYRFLSNSMVPIEHLRSERRGTNPTRAHPMDSVCFPGITWSVHPVRSAYWSGPKDARSPRALLGIRGTASES